jgi:hypothetical protein
MCEFIRTPLGYAIAIFDFDRDEDNAVYWIFGNDTARDSIIKVMQGEPGTGCSIIFSTLDEIETARQARQPTIGIIIEDEIRAEQEMSQ